MINLFIDTSLDELTIAIVNEDVVLAKKSRPCKNAHSVYTVSYIDDVLKELEMDANDIDNIMVVNGPGSFTGIRIGVSVAKTYGYLLKKDIYAISSLKMLALSTDNQIVISLIDAKNDNYYMGIFDMFDNDVSYETFASRDKVLETIGKYDDALLISNNEFMLGEHQVKKVDLDLVNIIKYYLNEKKVSADLLLPNYLKLPQALEDRNV